MGRFLVYILCISFVGTTFISAQDSTEVPNYKLMITGKVGNVQLTYRFDTLDNQVIRDAVINLDTLIDNSYRHKIYGHNLFSQDSLSLSQSMSSNKITDSYLLGVGDEIAVNIFGISQYEGKFVIRQDGFIKPERAPKILLKGLRWGAAKKLLERRFSNFNRFQSEQFSASIITPRFVTVNIFGEVTSPGSYEFAATNTAFNALRHAKGPTDIGSVRNIKVIDETGVRTLDLYKLYTDPSKQFDLFLNDNTVIQIPAHEKIVEIKGGVKRPLKYELKSKEGILDLIKYAGGFASNAIEDNIQILRYESGRRIVIDLTDKEVNNNYLLKRGDEVTIKEIEADKELIASTVQIEGAVSYPGNYSFSSNRTIKSLLERARLKTDARLDVAYLVRKKPNGSTKLIKVDLQQIQEGSEEDITLQDGDKLVVSSLAKFLDKSTIEIKGAVRSELEMPFDSDTRIHLSQLIFLAGGLDPEANGRGYIIRSNPNNLKEKEYIDIDIRESLAFELGAQDKLLKPWDEVIVLSSSTFSDQNQISIKGSVRKPGSIPYGASLTIKKLIDLAGGLKASASKKMTVVRLVIDQVETTQTTSILIEVNEDYELIKGPDNFKLMPYDQLIVRDVAEFELQRNVTIRGEVKHPGIYNLSSDNDRLLDIINMAGGMTNEASSSKTTIQRKRTGNKSSYPIITNIREAQRNPSDVSNHILKNHDIIIVPKKSSTVNIVLKNTWSEEIGEVDSTKVIGVQYEQGKSAKWYLDQFAGGIKYKPKDCSVIVVFANGAIQKSKGGLFKKYPVPDVGATIQVFLKKRRTHTSNKVSSENAQLKKGVIINIDSEKRKVKTEQIDDSEN